MAVAEVQSPEGAYSPTTTYLVGASYFDGSNPRNVWETQTRVWRMYRPGEVGNPNPISSAAGQISFHQIPLQKIKTFGNHDADFANLEGLSLTGTPRPLLFFSEDRSSQDSSSARSQLLEFDSKTQKFEVRARIDTDG